MDTDVVIVGAGPVGLTAALLLGSLGVRVCLVEKNPSTSTHPRGHVVNARTVEIFRALGIEDAVKSAGLPADRNTGISFVRTLASPDIGVIQTRGLPERDAAHFAASPSYKVSCPQDELEPILLAAARKLPGVEIHFNTELGDFGNREDGVVAHCHGPQGPVDIRAKYLIGADGTRSGIRERLGIEMEGQGRIGRQIGIYFEADLRRLIEKRPYLLFWILNPKTCGVMIALDGNRRWTYNFAFDAEKETAADFTPDRCHEIVRTIVGDDSVPITVRSVLPWRMTARLATHFRSGRVFIAGDAAHPLPPTGGQGMNTGIGDVHNLAWKIALVLCGAADPSLLDSYEIERRPVARINIEQSVHNAVKMAESGLSGMASHQSEMAEKLAGPDAHIAEEEIRNFIPELREHFDYLGQTFGHAYDSQWIVADGTEPPPFTIVDYHPVCRPGHRLPHAWLRGSKGTVSTIDLVGFGKFVLFTTAQGGSWMDAFARAAEARNLPHDAFMVGPGTPSADDGSILSLFKLGENGMVLVRPDGHVLARVDQMPASPEAAINAALDQAIRSHTQTTERIETVQDQKSVA